MGRIIQETVSGRIATILFHEFGENATDHVLRKELERYIPQFVDAPASEIADFATYQRAVRLEGQLPEMGRPIASLNPTFVDSLEGIHLKAQGLRVYSRASVKENGYRMQLHNDVALASAFTRQFTPYDLRMFPELTPFFDQIPVMIGDAELINASYPHLAGFNRVETRIPSISYWPKEGDRIDDALLQRYLADHRLFKEGMPTDEFRMTLAFHGLFAIADPTTWESPREEQRRHIISLTPLPVDYEQVDDLLDRLAVYFQHREIPFRVVERQCIDHVHQLDAYVRKNRDCGLEGTVVVQSAQDEKGKGSFRFAKSIKLKNYETIDAAVLGFFLHDPHQPLSAENLKAAMLGLYDPAHDAYLAACKVNLDPEGVQIKTAGQKERLLRLRQDLAEMGASRVATDRSLTTLLEIYHAEAELNGDRVLGNGYGALLVEALVNLPRRKTMSQLVDHYLHHEQEFLAGDLGRKTRDSATDRWIASYRSVLEKISERWEDAPPMAKELRDYLDHYPNIKQVSKRFIPPDLVLEVSKPLLVEAQVFDISWSLNPFPAGFHSWYCDSFHFNNCFAERIRHDKSTTTDYGTIYALARRNSVKPMKKKKNNASSFLPVKMVQ
ncbi:hypothetical protein HZB02_00615 [Candidatus Woesearchaeota archaeon]|nr:hypothetical protein [Candidatus Woesearchaeota archaeon]